LRRLGSIPVTERFLRATGLVSAVGMLLILTVLAGCNAGEPADDPTPTAAAVKFTATPQPNTTVGSSNGPADAPAPTAISKPTATPTPVPTVRPTQDPAAGLPAISAFPGATLFPVPVAPTPAPPAIPEGPFPTPTPRATKNVNLIPFAGSERGPGMVLSGDNGSGFYNAEDIVISW
jgi:hypothetical protein